MVRSAEKASSPLAGFNRRALVLMVALGAAAALRAAAKAPILPPGPSAGDSTARPRAPPLPRGRSAFTNPYRGIGQRR
jgi:hypothetical protein